MQKGPMLYEGKAKRVFTTEDPDTLILAFKDTATAFDGKKTTEFADKGRINNRINAHLMGVLAEQGVPVHFRRLVSDTESETYGAFSVGLTLGGDAVYGGPSVGLTTLEGSDPVFSVGVGFPF